MGLRDVTNNCRAALYRPACGVARDSARVPGHTYVSVCAPLRPRRLTSRLSAASRRPLPSSPLLCSVPHPRPTIPSALSLPSTNPTNQAKKPPLWTDERPQPIYIPSAYSCYTRHTFPVERTSVHPILLIPFINLYMSLHLTQHYLLT